MTPSARNTSRSGYRDAQGRALGARQRTDREGAVHRLGRWLGSLIDGRRTIEVKGVRYTELDAVPLRRRAARQLSKRYQVEFAEGTRMVIEASPARIFADLQQPIDLPEFEACEPLLRPGDRVLCLHAGTGHGPAWLADRVGPTGAVVALEADPTSIRYARHRYPSANTALEADGLGALGGELDGAFDVVLHRRVPASVRQAREDVAECWRLVAPGGGLVLLSADRAIDARDARRAQVALAEAIEHAADDDIDEIERLRLADRAGLRVRRTIDDLADESDGGRDPSPPGDADSAGGGGRGGAPA
ncbi:MAG: methyltransferase domain-containing protein [Planctomycetota bacterium]